MRAKGLVCVLVDFFCVLDVVLGNIHKQSLDEIFNGASACQTRWHYSRHCNDCWINCHRKDDIIPFCGKKHASKRKKRTFLLV